MNLNNIARLGIKELFSLKADFILMLLIVYIFSLAIHSIATSVNFEVKDASIAIVDEDRSFLSRRISSAFLPPQFKPAGFIAADRIDTVLKDGEYVFVVVFPPNFEKDLRLGNHPEIQVNIDASAIALAGNGAVYIQQIINREVIKYLTPNRPLSGNLPLTVNVRKLFNPNSSSRWFNALMQLVNSITMLGIILTGAALIREREHGTIEHLLVMPVTPAEIMLAKIWANGLVILVVALLSLWLVVHGWLGVPIQGSVLLFTAGAVLYLFSLTSLSIMLGTLTYSMSQFGLLIIPVVVVMYLLSGGTTPQESMPDLVRWFMQLSPSSHFVSFSQAVLYRGAGVNSVWPQLLTLSISGGVFFIIALRRFRKAIEGAA